MRVTGQNAELSAWMRAAQGGDAGAYGALLRECAPIIASVARREGAHGDAVVRVVEETLVAIHRARATYDPRRPFLPWLTAIAERNATDLLRQSAPEAGRSGWAGRSICASLLRAVTIFRPKVQRSRGDGRDDGVPR